MVPWCFLLLLPLLILTLNSSGRWQSPAGAFHWKTPADVSKISVHHDNEGLNIPGKLCWKGRKAGISWWQVGHLLKAWHSAADDKFAAYIGSMTTPGCTEGVDWMVFLSPLNISSSQRAVFPRFYNSRGQRLTQNYRDVQQHHGRTVNIYY